jgi:hypothetical protein
MRTATLVFVATLAAAAFGREPAARVYYVSSAGDDANDGASPERPLATPSRAVALLRPGDTLRLKRGDVFAAPITLMVSGSEASSLTIDAYGEGAKPVVTGFRPVTGWTAVGGGRYEATLAAFPSGPLEMVRVGGKVRAKGRWPKAGFAEGLRIKSHVKNTSITTTDEVPDVVGAEIVQKKYQWIIDRGRVDRIVRAKAETTIHFSDGPGTSYRCFDTHRFFFQNHPACVTEPGDWCYDAETHVLTLYAGSAPPADGEVEAAAADVLLDLARASHVRVSNISFVGSNADAASLDRAARVTFEACDFSSVGRNAISVVRAEGRPWYRESPGGTVRGCRISDVNNNGLDLGQNPSWTVVGNTITRVGMAPGMGRNGDGQYIGIFSPGDDSLIQHNEVSHIGYIGVYFVGNGTQVRNNHVHHFCLTKADGGGIYTYAGEQRLTFSRPRLVEGNIIHDGVGNIDGVGAHDEKNPYAPQCQGIYMDGNASDVVISRNTVYKVASAGLWLGSNGRIRAFGNTLVDNHTMQLGIDDQTAPPADLDVHDNLCIAFEPEQLCLSVSLRNKPAEQSWTQYVGGMGRLANNVYARPLGEPDGIRTKGYPHVPTFRDYPAGGVVGTSWDSLFRSLDVWKKEFPQDDGSRKGLRVVADPNDLLLVCNPTNSPAVVALRGDFDDLAGVDYRGSITLEPFASAVLLRRRPEPASAEPRTSFRKD